MPSFWAMSPVRMTNPPLELDLDVDAGCEVELHQRVHGLRRRIDDIEHALMRANFKLLARLLVDMRRAQHREALDARRQGNGTTHARARPLRRVYDFAGRLIEHAVVVSPEANTDVLIIGCH